MEACKYKEATVFMLNNFTVCRINTTQGWSKSSEREMPHMLMITEMKKMKVPYAVQRPFRTRPKTHSGTVAHL